MNFHLHTETPRPVIANKAARDIIQRHGGGGILGLHTHSADPRVDIAQAMGDLFARDIPKMRRWAGGRLPRQARDLADTHDIVQDAVLQTFKDIDLSSIAAKARFRRISGRPQ